MLISYSCKLDQGLNKQRAIDEKICLNNGVVGQETCGLGGFSFAMRVIPAVLEIIGKVEGIFSKGVDSQLHKSRSHFVRSNLSRIS